MKSTRESKRSTAPTPRFVCEYDTPTRRQFLRNVCFIYAIQLVVLRFCVWWATPGVVLAADQIDAATHPYVLIGAGIFAGLLFFLLWCIPAVGKTFPANLVVLALFTVAVAYLLAAIATFYNTLIVVQMLDLVILLILLWLFYLAMPCVTGVFSFLLAGLIAVGLYALVAIAWVLPRWNIVRHWNWNWLEDDGLWRTQERATEALGISIAILMAMVISLYVLYDLTVLSACLGPEDAIEGSFRLFVDSAGIIFVLIESIVTCALARRVRDCWKGPSGWN